MVTITTGRPPNGAGELVIDDKSAATSGYQLGDTVQLVTSGAQPSVTGTLVGTVRFGEIGQLDRRHARTVRHPDGAEPVPGRRGRVQRRRGDRRRRAVATPSCGTGSARRCRPGSRRWTTTQIAAENQTQLQQGLSFITTFLLVFAAVALVVGTFLILNTFSIIVAQRTRELALFRALGASKAQVTRSVLLEALVVGLVGSTIGLALGLRARCRAARRCSAAIGLDLGAGRPGLPPRTAIAAYAVGVLVTLLAAYLPARKAARVPPVAAMRDDVSIPESSMRRRLVGGAALTVRRRRADGLGAGLRRRPAAAGRRRARGLHRGRAAQPGDQQARSSP